MEGEQVACSGKATDAGVPVVVDIWVSADAVLEADVQVIPETAMEHHVSHHANPVF